MARRFVIPSILLATTAMLAAIVPSVAAEPAIKSPAPAMIEHNAAGCETAIFAGGCFWGVGEHRSGARC